VLAATRPGPRRITFVTSPDRCNLRCRMCRDHSPLAEPRDGDERLLGFDLVARVLDERRGTPLAEVVPSTRGEPLLWPYLDRLLAACEARGLRLNLTTNGTFPRGGPSRWAPRLAAVASDVKISWNGAVAATAEGVMQGLSFARALDGVRALVAARDALRRRGAPACTVSFQVTAQEANVAEVPAIVRLAGALGVDRVKLNQLQVHHAALAGDDLRRDPAARARWAAATRAAREEAAATGVRLENAVELCDADAAVGPCPFLDREAWVLADGAFAPCPSPRAPELGASLHDATLGEIWQGPDYRALVAEHDSRAECARCAFRRPGGM
jgi:MoaA/NifB/PqqE/SkfB family radical SAM enzyme